MKAHNVHYCCDLKRAFQMRINPGVRPHIVMQSQLCGAQRSYLCTSNSMYQNHFLFTSFFIHRGGHSHGIWYGSARRACWCNGSHCQWSSDAFPHKLPWWDCWLRHHQGNDTTNWISGFCIHTHSIHIMSILAERIKSVQLELNPDLSDAALKPDIDEDRPVILEKIGEGSVGIGPDGGLC